MTLGQKIKELRESKGMYQRQLASILNIGDGFLSKIENDQKSIRREHLKIISKTFNFSLLELEALWIANKIYHLVKDEKAGLKALKVAEQETKYKRTK